jgi:hypothetical protein
MYTRRMYLAASSGYLLVYTRSTYLRGSMYTRSTSTGIFNYTRSFYTRDCTSYETRSESSGFTTGGAKHRSKWIPAAAEWLRLQSSYTHDDELSAVKTIGLSLWVTAVKNLGLSLWVTAVKNLGLSLWVTAVTPSVKKCGKKVG